MNSIVLKGKNIRSNRNIKKKLEDMYCSEK